MSSTHPDAEILGQDLASQLRNMEEFASLGQFLFLFGVDVLKLPDFEREELEQSLLEGDSELVKKIRMSLLNMVTSQRGLTVDQFEEYTRRQYLKHKPAANPFGDAQACTQFQDLHLLDRVRILHQLSIWVFVQPDKFRQKMGDIAEKEQILWRIEPVGYDRHGNTYFMLDDNRLYRRMALDRPTEAPQRRKGGKTSKGRKAAVPETTPSWACLCYDLQSWSEFINTLEGSKHADEDALHGYLKDEVLPIITRAWEEKEKERQLQEMVANRKRSSRLDAKAARLKEQEECEENARLKAEELLRLKREKVLAERRVKERSARLLVREQMSLERAQRARDAVTAKSQEFASRRSSRTKAKPAAGAKTGPEEKDWIFECSCGAKGINYEDGTAIIACDSCQVWQHVACQNLPAGFEDSDFKCDLCRHGPAEQSTLDRPASPHSPVSFNMRLAPLSPVATSTGVEMSGIMQTGASGHPYNPPGLVEGSGASD